MEEKQKQLKTGRVFLRCRPTIAGEVSCVRINPNEGQISVQNNNITSKMFKLNSVFSNDASQKSVYEETTKDLVENLFHGQSSTVITYGQTDSGKTYTLCGRDKENEKGIIPWMFEDLFNLLSLTERTGQFQIHFSLMSLYNEQIIDLLCDVHRLTYPQIQQTPNGLTYIDKLVLKQVNTLAQMKKLFEDGVVNNKVKQTLMGGCPPREFVIFSVYLQKLNNLQKTSVDIQTKSAKIQFIDFAGSESLRKNPNLGRLRESKNADLSILSFSKIMEALVRQDIPNRIPYGESYLTRILKDSFEGNTEISIIGTISPAIKCFEEIVSTLEFLSRISSIFSNPKQKDKTAITEKSEQSQYLI